ncbi:MAG TPA: tRNA guanosine(34) transglycosylase Tgt [Anaerohalosphaeraceae bacterium]|nr:tRNA guanosine(34) transglycosylase Tgt [Anaerohalosphaeraceae bacterium]HOL88606.1 tRNA guanosine(34) transglycosylase Tgt [Anaerohalosphaeraceae bacterium]HPP56247.1 tRNA guanosine(34) transglycosylase Tgt [Anaerohalosphaeraceae bacterium]
MKHFTIEVSDSQTAARCGILYTGHGPVRTPAFMPVGTRGCVKGILPGQLKQTGAEMMLANTYHLLLRPGVEVIESLGGLHRFSGWEGPILTDSGGYQVFSLSSLNRVDDDRVEFASHIDGSPVVLDACSATRIQNRLGADIIMCFDECTPYPCPLSRLEKAVERTVRWAQLCRQSHQNPRQLLFGIVQGGTDLTLRRQCAQALTAMDFDGYAIGGLSVGEGHDALVETTQFTAPLLPADRPRYLMGVGMPADIVAAVRAGVDLFDCVLPTRNGRNAFAFTDDGPIRLRNSQWTQDSGPIEEGCPCPACRTFSKAAIRHFFNVGEMLGPILATLHNLTYYHRLMNTIRKTIRDGTFEVWSRTFIEKHKKESQMEISETQERKECL